MRKFSILFLLMAALVAASAQAEVIFTKRSLYRNITVTDEDGKICMTFANRGYYTSLQSCQFKDDPNKLVFDYARLAFAGLLVNPEPKRVLVVGLGGGSIPRTFRELYPDAKLDIVEIDEAVVDVAKRFFHYQPGENTRVVVKDARVFVKQAGMFGRKYDYIVLDAFNGDYIPEHLMTKEWLEECKKILTDDGVLIANTFSVSRLYHSESVTYEAVFGWIKNVKQDSGNRIILTGNIKPVTRDELLKKATTMNSERFAPYGFTPEWLAENAHDEVDWNREARMLTDQYAPVNLLQGAD